MEVLFALAMTEVVFLMHRILKQLRVTTHHKLYANYKISLPGEQDTYPPV